MSIYVTIHEENIRLQLYNGFVVDGHICPALNREQVARQMLLVLAVQYIE